MSTLFCSRILCWSSFVKEERSELERRRIMKKRRVSIDNVNIVLAKGSFLSSFIKGRRSELWRRRRWRNQLSLSLPHIVLPLGKGKKGRRMKTWVKEGIIEGLFFVPSPNCASCQPKKGPILCSFLVEEEESSNCTTPQTKDKRERRGRTPKLHFSST